MLAKVAPALGVAPEALEAVDGFVRVTAEPGKRMAWKEAAAKIGPTPASVTADRDKPGDQAPLFTANVGGINMAEVTVDIETGIVRIEEMVAVQDVGLVVSHKTCESQVLGAMIMGVCSALYEELIYDDPDRPAAQPEPRVLQARGHRRRRPIARAPDDRTRLRRARTDRRRRAAR